MLPQARRADHPGSTLFFSASAGLAEFEQYATAGLGMDESDPAVVGPRPRLAVDQTVP